MQEVRTRFAPSPTGFLHIGGARTALFNYAYAKHFGGQFFLRIEDTDVERSTKEYEADIIESLKWLGINHDGEITYQSNRIDIYKSYAKRLLKEEKAYYCFCSKEQLEEDRSVLIANGKKPMYVGRCRNLDHCEIEKNLNLDKPHVIRFKVERNGKSSVFKDLIRNQYVNINNDEIDDFVIVREDGIPTYNFAVVIDDALSEITHIIRGDDHVSNTPKQIMIYESLCFKLPQFAHVSMILGSDGKRLSKRHGATSVNQYKKEGFLPEALDNYLIRLGWSHGNDEIFSISDIIKFFDLKSISKSAATFNTEKLLWLNSHYIKSKDSYFLIRLINEIKEDSEKPLEKDIRTFSLIESMKTRVKTLAELRKAVGFYLEEELEYDRGLMTELNLTGKDIHFLKEFKVFLNGLEENIFEDRSPKKELEGIGNPSYMQDIMNETLSTINRTIESIKSGFNAFLSKNNWTMKEKAMIIRVALTGEKVSPPIYEIIFALGKEKCIKRIEKFSKFIS